MLHIYTFVEQNQYHGEGNYIEIKDTHHKTDKKFYASEQLEQPEQHQQQYQQIHR